MDGTTTEYEYNDANQITRSRVNEGAWNEGYTYDANGNLTHDGTNAYAWDRANRLLSMGGASYKYDGLGNRVQQTVNSIVTKYLLDTQPGLAVVLESAIGSDVTRFIHSPRGLHAQQQPNGDWVYPVQDALGSVRGMVDESLSVLESRLYAPYGVPFGVNGTQQTVYGFTGEPVDANELVYLRARYLSPGLGVFTSLDPVEGEIRRAMSLNRYGWVEGNVANATDSTGKATAREVAATLASGMCEQSGEGEAESCHYEEFLGIPTLRFLGLAEEWAYRLNAYQRLSGLQPWELKLLAMNAIYENGYLSSEKWKITMYVFINRFKDRSLGWECSNPALKQGDRSVGCILTSGNLSPDVGGTGSLLWRTNILSGTFHMSEEDSWNPPRRAVEKMWCEALRDPTLLNESQSIAPGHLVAAYLTAVDIAANYGTDPRYLKIDVFGHVKSGEVTNNIERRRQEIKAEMDMTDEQVNQMIQRIQGLNGREDELGRMIGCFINRLDTNHPACSPLSRKGIAMAAFQDLIAVKKSEERGYVADVNDVFPQGYPQCDWELSSYRENCDICCNSGSPCFITPS